MPACLEMNVDARRKYLRRMQSRYQKAGRERKGELLTEMEAVTGLHRKSLVRLLQAPSLEQEPRRQQRGRTYGVEVVDAVRVVWESLDYVCALRLTPSLLPTARHLARFGELQLSDEVAGLLAEISRPTVQRMLTRLSQDSYRLPRRGPELANRLAREIPMGRIPWDTPDPGHFEVDLVHHCGSSTNGEYVHSLQMIDVATGWSERVAILGRGQRAMEEGFRRIQSRLPYPIRQLHPDNEPTAQNPHRRVTLSLESIVPKSPRPVTLSFELTRAIAERILAAAKSTGARLTVAYMKRYDVSNELVRDLLARWRISGELGRLVYARAHGYCGDWTAGIGPPPVETTTEPAPAAATEEHLPDWLPQEWSRSYVSYLQQYTHNVNLLRFILSPQAVAVARARR